MDIEDHYDYVVFQVSTDGESWENLCGNQSKLGSLFQLYEEPLYDGRQTHWVLENVDLSSYLGQTIQLRFLLVSDGFVHKDGFYFDNFEVITIKAGTTATTNVQGDSFKVYPNPAGSSFTVSLPQLEKPSINVYNSLGHLIYAAPANGSLTHDVNAISWPAGLYHYQVLSDKVPVHSGMVSLIR